MSPLAIVIGACGALSLRPSEALAGSINCFTAEPDRVASEFVSSFCALSAAGGSGGGAGGSGSMGGSSSGAGRERRSSAAPPGVAGQGSNPSAAARRANNRAPDTLRPTDTESNPAGDPSSGAKDWFPVTGTDAVWSQPAAMSADLGSLGSLMTHEAWQRLVDSPATDTPAPGQAAILIATPPPGQPALLITTPAPGQAAIPTTPALTDTDGPIGPVSLLLPIASSRLLEPGSTPAPAARTGPNPDASAIGTSGIDALAVPEPGTLVLLGTGAVWLLAFRRRSLS